MAKWEYMYVTLNVVSGIVGRNMYRPRYVNDRELSNWKNIAIHDFSNQMGEQGWELVGTNFSYDPFTLIFKRPVP